VKCSGLFLWRWHICGWSGQRNSANANGAGQRMVVIPRLVG